MNERCPERVVGYFAVRYMTEARKTTKRATEVKKAIMAADMETQYDEKAKCILIFNYVDMEREARDYGTGVWNNIRRRNRRGDA